jgi:parallel beta-helix repeat protein
MSDMWTLTDRTGRIKASPPAPEGWTVYDARGVPKTTARAGLFNVLDFGADDSGATDSRQAFLDAAAAIATAGGGTLFVPDGLYTVNTDSYANAISLPSNCHLQLAANAVIQLAELDAGDNNHAVFRINAKSNVHISGGKIIGQRTGPTSGESGFGIYVGGGASDVLIEDVELVDFWGDGIYVGGSTVNTNIKIKHCTIDNCRRQGITVVFADNILIDGNTITGINGTAPQSGIDLEPNSALSQYVRQARIVNNHVENCVGGGIVLNGNQGALGAVDVSGCTVAHNTVKMSGSAVCIGVWGANAWDIDISHNRCYGGYGVYATAGTNGPVYHLTIEDNHCWGCVTGLYLLGVQRSTIKANQIHAPGGYGIRMTGYGGTYASTLDVISENIIDDGGDYGIWLQEVTKCNILGNVINGGDEQGIYFSGAGRDCIIALNQLYGCGTDGGAAAKAIDIYLPDYNLIALNMIRANSVTTKGIHLQSGSNYNMVLDNDVVELAAGSAIDDDGTGTVTTSGNRTA